MTIPLPRRRLDGPVGLEAALESRRSVREFSSEPLTLEHASQLLWAAQGINREGSGRTTPSAGAHCPIELYLVASDVAALTPGAYHYRPDHHDLTQCAEGDLRVELADASLQQTWMVGAPLVVVITAVFGRTTAEYGARGVNFVHMEVGSVYQNVHLQAAALELGTTVVGAFDDERVTRLLGLPADHEPLAMMPVGMVRRVKDELGTSDRRQGRH